MSDNSRRDSAPPLSSLSSLAAPSTTTRQRTVPSSQPSSRQSTSSSSTSSFSSNMSGPSERDDQHGEQKGEPREVIDNLRVLFSPSASSQGHVSLLQQAAGQRPVGLATRRPPTSQPLPAAAAAASALALDPLGDEQDDDLRPVATIEKFGPKIYARAMTMGGFTPWVNSQDFKATRNKREVEVLAQALDQLLLEGVSMEMSLGMEILARRLAAVHLADHSKNWKIAEAIQLPTVASSLLPQAELNAAIRTAATMTRLDASLHPRRSTTRYQRGGGGYGGYGGYGGGGGGGGGGYGGGGGGYRHFNRGRGGRGNYGRGAQRPQQDGARAGSSGGAGAGNN
jgi:hypothetical protein